MSMKENERQVLRCGCLLIACAAIAVLAVLHFDQVWASALTLGNAVAPALGGLVLAYVLNVFVHFFEELLYFIMLSPYVADFDNFLYI